MLSAGQNVLGERKQVPEKMGISRNLPSGKGQANIAPKVAWCQREKASALKGMKN